MSSAAELITNVKTFDIKKVTYGAVKVNKNGKGKSGGIYYGGKKLLLQFPLMFTWGASEMVDDESGKKSYSVSIPIKNDQAEASYPLFAAMNAIQEKVLNDASSHSKEWFGKTMSRDVAEALFTPMVKYPKVSKTDSSPDFSKTPSLKTKIQFWEDKFTIEIYNMEKEQLFGPQAQDNDPIALMPQGTYMAGLIECGGLWFTGTGFGVTWKLIQTKIRPPVKITGFCLMDDEEEEEQLRKIEERERKEQEKEKQQHQQTSEPEQPHPTMIDDDEEPTPATEEPAAPAPTTIKKVVKKVVKK
jgi:hypothetical protein